MAGSAGIGSMLKRQQGESVPVPSESPVFGKPWYWQRGSGSAESTRSLARVIMEMRGELKKLETEERALRAEAGPGQPSFGTEPGEASQAAEGIRRNVSAPALEGQYKEDITMTVRRYSFVPDRTPRAGGGDSRGHGASSWGRLQQEVHRHAGGALGGWSPDETNASAGEKTSNRLSFQDYVHKNRAKVKTVTFLLPVDDIYTNRPFLAKPPADPDPSQLDAIVETDSW